MSNSLKLRLFICGVVLLIAGIACASASLAEKREMAKGMMDFNEMQASDFYKGQYVQGELLELWDEFAYMEEYTETMGIKGKSRVSAHYYVMPLQTSYETGSPVFALIVMIRSGKVASRSPSFSTVAYSFQKVISQPSTVA